LEDYKIKLFKLLFLTEINYLYYTSLWQNLVMKYQLQLIEFSVKMNLIEEENKADFNII